MRGVVHGFLIGDKASWIVIGVLWTIATALLLSQRGSRAGTFRTMLVLAVTTVTSLLALPLASALAVPRLRWKAVDAPDLVASSGSTWRKLRGPLVAVVVDGVPDVVVPTVDASGRWLLYGLVSGRALPALAAAPAATPDLGGARLCKTDGEACRAWPQAWPDPSQAPSVSDLVWSRDPAGPALAFDTESESFLQSVDTAGARDEERALQIDGHVASEPTHDGASSLFVVRSLAKGRLRAVRVIATPLAERTSASDPTTATTGEPGEPQFAPHPSALGAAHAFHLERAEASLDYGPRALRYVIRPLLLLTSFALPIGFLLMLIAPAWLRARLAKQGAKRREAPGPVVLVMVPATEEAGAEDRRASLSDDLESLPRGARVAVGFPKTDDEPIVSHAWLDLAKADEPAVLVPADPLAFRRAARAKMAFRAAPVAVFVAGLSAACPAFLALVGLLASR